jgi:hypothetical protein
MEKRPVTRDIITTTTTRTRTRTIIIIELRGTGRIHKATHLF